MKKVDVASNDMKSESLSSYKIEWEEIEEPHYVCLRYKSKGVACRDLRERYLCPLQRWLPKRSEWLRLLKKFRA